MLQGYPSTAKPSAASHAPRRRSATDPLGRHRGLIRLLQLRSNNVRSFPVFCPAKAVDYRDSGASGRWTLVKNGIKAPRGDDNALARVYGNRVPSRRFQRSLTREGPVSRR